MDTQEQLGGADDDHWLLQNTEEHPFATKLESGRNLRVLVEAFSTATGVIVALLGNQEGRLRGDVK